MKILLRASALILLVACSRGSGRSTREPRILPAAEPPRPTSVEPSAQPPAPTLLIGLPVSAYNAWLALDGEVTYLFSHGAGYRLRPGAEPQRLDVEFGNGPVLTDSGIVFWSKGAIWNAAKDGATVWKLAALDRQPEYFVASEAGLAWLERAADGKFAISALRGQKAQVLVADPGEISGLAMVHGWVFFVVRGKDSAWRIGRVSVTGADVQYTGAHGGPTPAQLTGTESIFYYDMERSEVHELTPDLKSEHVWIKDFVCSPIYEATNVYCARVEGLFAILAGTRTPKPLLYGRRETITFVRANAKRVVWIADAGPDQLAVESLALD